MNKKKTDLLDYARSEFKKNLKISKRDFDTVRDYLIYNIIYTLICIV